MKRVYSIILLLSIPFLMIAQKTVLSPIGEYYLRGVMETASGFKLDKDSSFQFFFSYGALDRFGSGTWTAKGDHVILNSEKKHTSDFALLQSTKTNSEKITIKIIDSNTMMLRHVYCMIDGDGKKQDGVADADGNLSFTPQNVDSIVVLFEFCPEKKTVITISAKDHNYFEIRFEPWIMDVLFENFALQINDKGLTGKHPLLDDKTYSYEKAGH